MNKIEKILYMIQHDYCLTNEDVTLLEAWKVSFLKRFRREDKNK